MGDKLKSMYFLSQRKRVVDGGKRIALVHRLHR
jgi:hypothetical protein